MSLERGWKPDPEKPFARKELKRWYKSAGASHGPKAGSMRKAKKEHTRRSRIHSKRTTVRELKHWKELEDGDLFWY